MNTQEKLTKDEVKLLEENGCIIFEKLPNEEGSTSITCEIDDDGYLILIDRTMRSVVVLDSIQTKRLKDLLNKKIKSPTDNAIKFLNTEQLKYELEVVIRNIKNYNIEHGISLIRELQNELKWLQENHNSPA